MTAGTLQGRYTVIRKVADGGMAEIFLATQHGAQGFEKTVVLKRIRAAYYADPQFRDMLVDEAHIAMGLGHSNIAQVLDLGDAGGRYFLALELVDGWSVDHLLRRARKAGVAFPPELALYIAAEVCRGLAYAHARKQDERPLGIVHRDVSTHNVLVSEQGEVKLTDFGIAKAQGRREVTADNVVKGKISFMSPEQASGQPLDARSDIFSLGVVLYEMALGKRPFAAPTDLEALLLVKNCQFPPPMRPGLNPQVSRIIMRAMRKTPAERYQTSDEMLGDVERVLRVGFRPAGQSEMKQWLRDLGTRDGIPPLSRAEGGEGGDEISHSVIMAREADTVTIAQGDIVSMRGADETPTPEPEPVTATDSGPKRRRWQGLPPVPPAWRRPLPIAVVATAIGAIVFAIATASPNAPAPPAGVKPAMKVSSARDPAAGVAPAAAPTPAATTAESTPLSPPAAPLLPSRAATKESAHAPTSDQTAPAASTPPAPSPSGSAAASARRDSGSGGARAKLAASRKGPATAQPTKPPPPPPPPPKKEKRWWPFGGDRTPR